MRWIFYSLLTINLGFFLWQMLPKDEPEPAIAAQAGSGLEGVASIALLHEAQEQAEPYDLAELARELELAAAESEADTDADADSGAGAEVPGEPAVDTEQLCDAIGPFIERDRGDRLAGALQNQGIQTSLVSEFVQLAGGYWVYIEPQASTQAAIRLSSELKRQGVDAYLISEGELSNGLSLGIYSLAADAESLRLRLQAAEITVVVEEKATVHEEFWVLLMSRNFASIEPEKLPQLPEFTDQNQVIKKVCKPVASTP